MRTTRILIRLLVSAFILLCIDGFWHRDPTVDLGNGYEIVAVSASSPCVLNYRPWEDKRDYSDWHAIASTSINGPDGEQRTPFLLTHDKQDWLEFDNEDDWRREWKERNATFGPNEIGRVENITGFRGDGRYVVGEFDEGFFLLDMVQNRVDKFRNREQWQQAVVSVSDVSTNRLKNPKSWVVQ